MIPRSQNLIQGLMSPGKRLNEDVLSALASCLAKPLLVFLGSLSMLGLGCSDTQPSRALESSKEITLEQQEIIDQLNSLGYLDTGRIDSTEKDGVLTLVEEEVLNSVTLYSMGGYNKAVLIDILGNELHEWHTSFSQIQAAYQRQTGEFFEDTRRTLKKSETNKKIFRFNTGLQCPHLLDNGEIIAIFSVFCMVKLDKESNVMWVYPQKVHHHLDVTDDGDIYVLTYDAKIREDIHPTKPFREEGIAVVDENGNEKRHVSIYDCFVGTEFHSLLKPIRSGDFLHSNSVQYMDGSLVHLSSVFKKGNVLISLRNSHIVAMIDMEKEKVVWVADGITGRGADKQVLWARQHASHVTPDGTIVLFDNLGPEKDQQQEISRIAEFEPSRIVETKYFSGQADAEFFSETNGGVQPLENGNLLITVSREGAILEMNREQDIVWEFKTPYRDDESGKIYMIWDAMRMPRDYGLDWLQLKSNPL